MRRPVKGFAGTILAVAVLAGMGWCGGLPTTPTRPAGGAPARAPASGTVVDTTGADEAMVPEFGRFFGTWLWLKTEGLVADSDPETKGAHRRLILNPDLTYEFHQRRATRDTLLCRGSYTLSEQTSPRGTETDLIAFDGWYESYEKNMIADFDAPDTLHLLGYPCENCPDHTFARGEAAAFHGEVAAGRTYRFGLWDGLSFELDPLPLGWEIAVRDTTRPDENLARLTPPLHFAPQPRLIEGWHFRNKDNTGPNRGDVNAPQRVRDFIFSREVGRTIQGAHTEAGHEPTEEEIERVGEAGRGVLTIEEMKLSEPKAGAKAAIESMKFTVAIEEVRGIRR